VTPTIPCVDPRIYVGDERVGATVRRAYDDAMAWMESGSAPTQGAMGTE
jgi:hypothetical protein